jgi:hypothetical protein
VPAQVPAVSPDDPDPEGAGVVAGAVDAVSLAGCEVAEPGEPERVSEALGVPEGDPAAPDPPPSGWHPVTISAAEAATITITDLRMPFPYCMSSPEFVSHRGRSTPALAHADRAGGQRVRLAADL